MQLSDQFERKEKGTLQWYVFQNMAKDYQIMFLSVQFLVFSLITNMTNYYMYYKLCNNV